jgi:ceramide glucosyltransferase
MLAAAEVVHCAGAFCLTGAALGCAYLAMLAIAVLRFRSGEPTPMLVPVSVSVLVPLCGREPGLAERLRRLCCQNYPGSTEIVCGTLDPNDPAIEVVQCVAAEHNDVGLSWHVHSHVCGQNLKMANVTNTAKHARHEMLVLIDSDILVGPNYLASVVAELQRPGVGAVTCLFHGIGDGNLWSRLAAMSVNVHFLPNVIGGLTLGRAHPCFGATIAVRRDVLRRIGGFAAFADQLWDDYAIGDAIRGVGYTVSVAPFAVGHVQTERTWRELEENQVRQSCTIKSIDPLGHVGSVITHPLPLALAGFMFGGGVDALALALVAFACRVAVSWCVGHRFNLRSSSYLLIPLRDLVSFAAYAASFFVLTVTWRGQRYRLSDQALITESRPQTGSPGQT